MKVYLSELIADSARKELEEKAKIVSDFSEIEQIDAMLIRKQPVTREMMERAKNLKVISRHGVGCDMIDMQAAKELGIKVVNLPGANAESVAELAVTFMMSLSRKLKLCDRGLQDGAFTTFSPKETIGFELEGKTLALIGTGHIARKVAHIMKAAFGMRVIGCSPHLTEDKARELGIERFATIEDMYEVADYINVSVPLTDATRNLITARDFARMKPTAILVNTARGGIVNEADLYDALSCGQIFAAASDVFEIEPPEKENPLLKLDNFLATPHNASATYECMERCGHLAVQNLFDAI